MAAVINYPVIAQDDRLLRPQGPSRLSSGFHSTTATTGLPAPRFKAQTLYNYEGRRTQQTNER